MTSSIGKRTVWRSALSAIKISLFGLLILIALFLELILGVFYGAAMLLGRLSGWLPITRNRLAREKETAYLDGYAQGLRHMADPPATRLYTEGKITVDVIRQIDEILRRGPLDSP